MRRQIANGTAAYRKITTFDYEHKEYVERDNILYAFHSKERTVAHRAHEYTKINLDVVYTCVYRFPWHTAI